MTLRKIRLQGNAIDELLWIWQKKSNNITRPAQPHLGRRGRTKTARIGKAYGYQLGVKHRYPEGDIGSGQTAILYDLKHNPGSRRIISNIYNHADLSEMRLYPCAYSYDLQCHLAIG